jgi:hypothetical protein
LFFSGELMKVKIGPYLDWWGPYQLLGLLTHVGVSKEKTDEWAESSPDWFTDLCQWVHDKRQRKIKVKLHNYDTWSMDRTLAIIILPMLKQLKSTKHGSAYLPVFDQTSNSAQYCFDFYGEGDDAAWTEGAKQWDEIMDKMIWSFEQLQPDCDWEAMYCEVPCEIDFTDYPEDEGKVAVPLRWKNEGKYDFEGMKIHEARITEGLKLFGEYYQNLWD